MRLTSIVLIFLILFSCEKDSYHHILIFGHAGMGLSMQNSIYHDNSFEAVELCLSIPGSNGVEVDVQMDRDGCLWLYHDEHLDDITNLTGCINDCSTSKLETAYYKTLKKEKLVKLNTIISILNNDQKLFLDIKSTNACSGNHIETIEFLEGLSSSIDSDSSKVKLIVADMNLLNLLNQEYATFFSTNNFDQASSTLTQYPQTKGVVIRSKSITYSQIEYLKDLGKEVYLFDLRSPKGHREALKKHPNGILSDDIRAALIERN